ncbi:MAG: glycosyltransferase family A protein [Bacillus sp. (in: firmicutes)]
MIYFGIPLRSKHVSNDWEMVTKLFNRTLRSVYNQTNPSFKIIIASHEIPQLFQKYDDRVEFIQVDIPTPNTKDEMMIDKGYKVHEIGMRIRELGGGFTMMVDADDLISNRIAEYVNNHHDKNGFLSHNGYYYHIGNSYIKKGHKFPNGSSTIVKYLIDDLPNKHYEELVPSQNSNPHILRKRHGDIPLICKQLGKPLEALPFIASIYVRETGDNHSLMGKDESRFRTIEQLIMPKIRMNDTLREEFSIDWI